MKLVCFLALIMVLHFKILKCGAEETNLKEATFPINPIQTSLGKLNNIWNWLKMLGKSEDNFVGKVFKYNLLCNGLW